jgi:hypothetical protein
MGLDMFMHREFSDLAKNNAEPDHGNDIEGRDAHTEPRKWRDRFKAIAVQLNQQGQHRGGEIRLPVPYFAM